MRYLVKEFFADIVTGRDKVKMHLVTDDGDEKTEGSLWRWLWLLCNGSVDISVYRLTDDLTKAEDGDEILMIDHEGKPTVDLVHVGRAIAELKADPSIDAYLLTCVLDLS